MVTVHVRAPVRVDFAGGWSDVPEYADEYGGAVVNVAIAQYVNVDVAQTNRGVRLVSQELDQRIENADAASLAYDGTLDLHKAAVRMFPCDGGVDVTSWSSVPLGSGLGTSGALDVALVAGLRRCRGDDVSDMAELAELAFRLEAVELGLTGGRQDQYAAAFGGFLHLEFSRDHVEVHRLRLNESVVLELHRSMVLAYTGRTHFSSATHDRVWAGFRDGQRSVREALRALRDLAAPTAEALQAGDWRRLAESIDENWKQQQRLHPSIATSATRAVEAAARQAGAWGAKATGAGAGGCMIFIGPPDSKRHIEEAIAKAGGTVLDCGVDTSGVVVT